MFRLCFLLLMLIQAGIANAGLLSDDEARKQIQAEHARIDDLQTQAQALSDRLDKAEAALQSDGLVDLFEKIEDLKSQVNDLRGQIEVLNNSIDVANKQQRDMYVDLDTRLRALEQAQSTTAPAAVTSAPTSSVAVKPAVVATATATTNAAANAVASATNNLPSAMGTPPTKENDAYNAALALHRNRDYQNAIAAFQNFLKQFPSSALAPRAQYWIGDSYYNLRDYSNAIASQQTLIANYPQSPSVPDAMLNIATSQQDSGDVASAQKTLQDLVAKYPVSDSGQKAKRRLAMPPFAAAAATPAVAQ